MSGGTDREPPGPEAFRLHQSGSNPRPSRIGILETADGLGIYNPSRRSWPLVIFLAAWLSGWSAGEYFAVTQIVGAPLPVVAFLAVWLSLWTVAGIGVAAVVLWQLGGAELLFLTSGSLVRELRFFGLARRTVVPLDEVGDFGLAREGSANAALRPGKIRFSVSGEPARFGIGLSDDEAKAALTAVEDYLTRRLPGGGGGAQTPHAGKPIARTKASRRR